MPTLNTKIQNQIQLIITYFFNQQIAIASILAFSISESVDWFGFKILKWAGGSYADYKSPIYSKKINYFDNEENFIKKYIL